ncbi:MAG: hypothetical protein ACPGLY_23680 [Rubripirellula sp.]
MSINRSVGQKSQRALWLKVQGLLLLSIVSALLLASFVQRSSGPGPAKMTPEVSRIEAPPSTPLDATHLRDPRELIASDFADTESVDHDPDDLLDSGISFDHQLPIRPASESPFSSALYNENALSDSDQGSLLATLARQNLDGTDLSRELRVRDHQKVRTPATLSKCLDSETLEEFGSSNLSGLFLGKPATALGTETLAPYRERGLTMAEHEPEPAELKPLPGLVTTPWLASTDSNQVLSNLSPLPPSMITRLSKPSGLVAVDNSLAARINQTLDSRAIDAFTDIREGARQSVEGEFASDNEIQSASFQAEEETESTVPDKSGPESTVPDKSGPESTASDKSGLESKPNDTAIAGPNVQSNTVDIVGAVAADSRASTEEAIIAVDYAKEDDAELNDGNGFEPIVQSGIIEEPNFDTVLPLQPSARMAMMQVAESNAPAPSQDTSADENKKADDEKTAENTDTKQAAPGPAKNSDHHMVSELIGSGYGCISRVFDSGFYVANELTLLAPQTVGNVKVGVTDQLATNTVSESSESGLGFGNRLTLGIRGQHSGLQCQYWAFASENVLAESWQKYRPIPRFLTSSTAELETLDLVITQKLCLFGCQWESGFGGRYAKYNGEDTATIVDQMHDSLELTGLARATRHLRGAGPVLALSGRRNLGFGFWNGETGLPPDLQCEACGHDSCMGTCNSWRTASACFPWTIYWNGKISWLWAEESGAALTEAIVTQNAGSGGAATARSRDKALIFDDQESSFLTLGFQVGLEYSCPVFCRSQFIARVGFEYQYWDLGGNVAESQSFAFLTDDSTFGGRIDALASSNRTDMRLSGATFLIGLNY